MSMSDALLPDQNDDALAGHDTIYDRPETERGGEPDILDRDSSSDDPGVDEPLVRDTPFHTPTGERVNPADD